MPKREISGATIDGDEVTVMVNATSWIKPLGPAEHPYDKAMRRLTRKLAADPEWTTWWASSGYRRLWFHQSHRQPTQPERPWPFIDESEADLPPSTLLVCAAVDLKTAYSDHTSAAATRAARANLAIILDRVADHIGEDHPPPAV